MQGISNFRFITVMNHQVNNISSIQSFAKNVRTDPDSRRPNWYKSSMFYKTPQNLKRAFYWALMPWSWKSPTWNYHFLTNMKFSKGDTVSIGELNVTFYSLSYFFQVILLCLRIEFSVQICQGIVLSLSVLSAPWHFCSDIFHSL